MRLYIDMDGVLCDFDTAYQTASKLFPNAQDFHLESGFYRHLKPIYNAIESVNTLIQSNQYDIYILTAPAVRNPYCYMEKRLWIEQYFNLDLAKKLIISPNKGLLIGDILIDDHLTGWGIESFKGKILHFGQAKFPHWQAILAELL